MVLGLLLPTVSRGCDSVDLGVDLGGGGTSAGAGIRVTLLCKAIHLPLTRLLWATQGRPDVNHDVKCEGKGSWSLIEHSPWCQDHKNHDCSICAAAKLNKVLIARVSHSFTARDPLVSFDYTGEVKVEPYVSASACDLSATTTIEA